MGTITIILFALLFTLVCIQPIYAIPQPRLVPIPARNKRTRRMR